MSNDVRISFHLWRVIRGADRERGMETKPFTAFDNDLLEALVKQHLTGAEWDAVLVIVRYTKGFHRESHYLSLSFIAKATGRNRITVHRILGSLRERGIISRTSEASLGKAASYCINPPEKWVVSSAQTVSPHETGSAISMETNSSVSTATNSPFHPCNPTVSANANQERKCTEREKESGKESGVVSVLFLKDKNSEETSEDLIHRKDAPISPEKQMPSYIINQAIIVFNKRFFESSQDAYYMRKGLELQIKERLKCKRWVTGCNADVFARHFARIIEPISPSAVHRSGSVYMFMGFVRVASQCCKT
jgi:phage replication O-like protein O